VTELVTWELRQNYLSFGFNLANYNSPLTLVVVEFFDFLEDIPSDQVLAMLVVHYD
jgi:hypothetical protein